MVTLFTTTKNFTGQNKINQLNAIQSWLKAPYPVEIIIFGDSEGLAEVIATYNLIHIKNVKSTERGIPLINHMFTQASQKATYPVCCFLNADIVLTRAFFVDIAAIHKKARKNYLIVGQRLDVTVETAISFHAGWEEEFFEKYSRLWKVHLPYGSDFFVFPRGQYTIKNIPDLLVGRPGWDLFMIYHARKYGFKTIDLSFSTKVIHLNHDYSHKAVQYNSLSEDPEAMHNLKYLPKGEEFIYTLPACNYVCQDGKIEINYARGDMNLYHFFNKKFKKVSVIKKIYTSIIRFTSFIHVKGNHQEIHNKY